MQNNSSLLPDSGVILRWIELDAAAVQGLGARGHQRRAQMQAVLNWLERYRAREDAKPLEQVKGYLQAFQHLCTMEDWERAVKLLQFPLNTPTQEGLLNQLKTWGYGGEQVALCRLLEGRVEGEWAMVVLNTLGTVEIDRGNFVQGIGLQERHLELACASGNEVAQGYALGNLGLAYYRQGQIKEAIAHLQEALVCFKHLTNLTPERLAQRREVEAVQGILGNLGLAYAVLGEYDRAEECHRQSLQLAEARQDIRGAGLSWGCLGRVQQSLGDWGAAASAYDRQWQAGVTCQDRGLILKGLINRAGLKALRGMGQTALALWQEAAELARALGDRHAQGLVAVGLGDVWYRLGELESSIAAYEAGLEGLRQTGDRRSLGQALTGLALVLEDVGEIDKAIDYHKQSLELAREVGYRSGEAKSLSHLGGAYAVRGDYQEAMALLVDSLELAWELEDRDQERVALAGMGNVAFWVGNFGEARRFYGLALEIAEMLGSRSEQAVLLMNLGAVALEVEAFLEAEEWLLQALELAKQLGMQALVKKVQMNLAILKGSIPL